MKTTLETLYDQIVILCPENERGHKYVELIESQLELFNKNFDLYKTKYPSVIDDYLRMLLHVVINVFSEKEFTEAADRVNELSKRYFSDAPQVAKSK